MLKEEDNFEKIEANPYLKELFKALIRISALSDEEQAEK